MAVSKIGTDFVPFTTLNNNVMYARKNGVVYVRTTAGGLNLNRAGVNLGTLPTGFRPKMQSDFAATGLGGTASVFLRVNTNGDIIGYANPDTTYWSGAFSFLVAI